MTTLNLSEIERALEPCPFCGDPHPGVMVNACDGTYVHYVICKCGARAKEYVGGFNATLAEAIEAWNTRQAPAMIARIRELEGVGQEMAHRQEKLIEALHAAINSPKGVVPRVAEQFYDPRNHLKGAE